MYFLKEYYLNKNKICEHIVNYSQNIEEINNEKNNICKMLNKCNITAYEILATKNINSLQEILKRDNVKIFQVVNK